MSIDYLINKIIPPSNFEHRDGFTNEPIIDKLSDDEKLQVEDALIEKLSNGNQTEPDFLITETLSYLKSQKSLPILYGLLNSLSKSYQRLTIATYIFKINQDNAMVDIAIQTFNNIESQDKNGPYYVYSLISTFYLLKDFKKPELNNLIEKYTDSEELLLASNSKRALYYQNKLTGNYIPNDMYKEELELHNSRVKLQRSQMKDQTKSSLWMKIKQLFY